MHVLLLPPSMLLSLAGVTSTAATTEAWEEHPDTVCGCEEGNSRNWVPANPNPVGDFGSYWVKAPRHDIHMCKELCEADSACQGFQWTAESNQIPERDVCWFRRDPACAPSVPVGVCEARQCVYIANELMWWLILTVL